MKIHREHSSLFQYCLLTEIAAHRAAGVFALLFRLRGNPLAGSRGEKKNELMAVHGQSLHLFFTS